MVRWTLVLPLAAAACLCAQTAQEPKPAPDQRELKRDRPPGAPGGYTEAPPEEDSSIAQDKYAFNPLESENSVKVGNFYAKQGNRLAALGRYQEATRWNPGNSEAWLRVGETAEKLKSSKLAKEAYVEYLKLEPDAKNASDIKKRIGKLK